VSVRRDGNRTYYRPNRIHPLYPEIRSLVLKTSGLGDVLRQALAGLQVSVSFVFGSVAEGIETPESDVDLMVVGSPTLRQLSKPLAHASSRLGREINAHVLTPAEFARRKQERDHFLESVLARPRVYVIGSDDELEAVGR
jgi:predicted nucleotidyltransferase